MNTITCKKCDKPLNSEEVIQTDEFKELGSEIKNYCSECFVEGAKDGFGHYDIGNCTVCNYPLVLQYDDLETVSVAQDDFTVHYVCKKIKNALDNGDQKESERLEEEGHDLLILYTIQPDSEESEF